MDLLASAPDPAGNGHWCHVFVYGTLRRGEANDINHRHPAPRWVGEACIAGVMHHLGAYPGLVLGSGGSVQGEVYAIAPALEEDLDRLEGVQADGQGEYLKRWMPVVVNGQAVVCLVYEIHPGRIRGAPRITGGDWVQRVANAPFRTD